MGFQRGALAALVTRPRLALEAVRTFFAMRGRRRLVPSRHYLRWRALTAYGDQEATVSARDLLDYLHWRTGMRAIRRGERWG